MAEKHYEGNQKLAAFMGHPWDKEEAQFMQFHSCWNWLMQVYKKINEEIELRQITNALPSQIAMQDDLLEADMEGVWTNAIEVVKELTA